jgi:integrase
MRTCEVLDLKKSDITERGLIIRRSKGSRDNIVTWTPRLEAVIKKCESLPKINADIADYHLIRGQKGDKLTVSGFQTVWQRNIMKIAIENGMVRWTFHDLKAKGISETEGNKQEASGHKSAAMVDTYNRKLTEVKPAGKE